MADAIVEMSTKSLGCVGITESGRLVGIITDGDLRRHMGVPEILNREVDSVMTRAPVTVRPDQLAAEALEILNALKKTQLMVVDVGRPVGVVHFHDLLRAGVA